jgi:hypothetical protein
MTGHFLLLRVGVHCHVHFHRYGDFTVEERAAVVHANFDAVSDLLPKICAQVQAPTTEIVSSGSIGFWQALQYVVSLCEIVSVGCNRKVF